MEVMTDRINPEKMRSATLSEGTKDYLVAYRMVDNGVDLAVRQVEEYWGEAGRCWMRRPPQEAARAEIKVI